MRFADSIWLWGVPFALLIGALSLVAGLRLHRARLRFGHEPQIEALLTGPTALRRALSAVLLTLAVALAFLAAARPQYGQGTRVLPATNLDVVLVLDYSKSMYARDVNPSRIERAKIEMARLVQKLAGARLGAVAFAGEPLSFPLTSDGSAIAQFFRGLEPNDMPIGGTAIGSALGAGRELFRRDPRSERHEKVMVLFTDGEDLEGDPVAVAREAAQSGIRIEVVQIGGTSPEPIPDVAEDGSVRGLRRDRSGAVLTTALSPEGEKQLQDIASNANGNYTKAQQGEVGVDEIGTRLRALMTEELSERVETVYADVFHYPLALAVLLSFLEVFLGTSKKRLPPPALPRGQRKRRVPRRLRETAVLLSLGLLGCEPYDKLFERDSPTVSDAIEALGAHEPERAIELLTEYLETGPCEAGVLGAGDRARSRGDAALDLGLGFAALHDEKSKPPAPPSGIIGLPGAEPPAAEPIDASRIECALRLLAPLGENTDHPAELRASAFYLMGNLEMRREEFRAAASAYDRGLVLVPAVPAAPDAPPAFDLGRNLAHNRAVALRRAREKEEQEKKDEDSQSNTDPNEQNQDEQKPPPDDQEKKDEEQKDEPQSDDQKKDEQDQGEQQGQDDQQKDEQDSSSDDREPEQEDDSQKDGGASDPGEPQESQASPAQQSPSVSQDERLLDQLEQAPTLQQLDAQRRRGRVRSTMEDK